MSARDRLPRTRQRLTAVGRCSRVFASVTLSPKEPMPVEGCGREACMKPSRTLGGTHGVVAFLIAAVISPQGTAVGAESTLANGVEGAVRMVPVVEQLLRATNSLDYWELIGEESPPESFLESRRFLLSPREEIEHTALARYFDMVLVGHISNDRYLIGIAGTSREATGTGERTFLVVAEATTQASAEATARSFANLYNGRSATSPTELLGGPLPFCPCDVCGDQLEADIALCTAASSACVAAAAAAGAACTLGCLGVPVCIAACAVATAAAIAACTLSLAICNRAAVRNFQDCEATCNP